MMLEGNRIFLREISEKDLETICDIESDKDLWRYEENITTDRDKIKQKFIDRINNIDVHDFFVYSYIDRHTPIGEMNIWSYVEGRRSWEIGYTILPQYQHQGFCKEGVLLLLDFAFKQLDAHKVVGMCNEYNTFSAAVMSSVGMTREAVFRQELNWNNMWVDQFFYCILEHEYFHSITI